MSRIYVVKDRKTAAVIRYVRASTLNGAIRAVAGELFDASAASSEDIFQATKSGGFQVLDAIGDAP